MRTRLTLMVLALLVAAVLFMTVGARGNWSFILSFRGEKLAALLLVAISISTSTVLFQTITGNRILTPSIMGFDALYLLILTTIVFLFGSTGYVRLPEVAIFLLNLVLLTLASGALFGTLLASTRTDLIRMILTGIIFGVLFRSLTALQQRMIDPNEFGVIQVASYARFNQINTEVLAIATMLGGLALARAWQIRYRLDVLALGWTAATNLGEDPRRGQLEALAIIAVLVSVSTALVGPVAFFGLLVVSLAHVITPSVAHAVLLPSAALISAIVLIAGQTIIERVLALSTPLSVVVEFGGGMVFLLLLLRGTRRD